MDHFKTVYTPKQADLHKFHGDTMPPELAHRNWCKLIY